MSETGDLERGFHNRDGWFFRRDSKDGHVRVWKVRWEMAGWPCDCSMGRPDWALYGYRDPQTGRCAHEPTCTSHKDPRRVPVIEVGPHVIPENEWASIVASVSRGGETAESWQAVRDQHATNYARNSKEPPS